LTVLVDEARWPWRGQRWAHLCSDRSLAELHAFAATVGIRRVSFQGDHYDVDADKRAEALAAGAVPVEARELVRRVRAAGLLARAVRAEYRWRTVIALEAGGGDLDGLGAALAEALGPLVGPARLAPLLEAVTATLAAGPTGARSPRSVGPVAVRALTRPGEVALVISRPGAAGTVAAGVAALVDDVHHTVDRGTAVTELFVRPA
jgi:hypothetical protein